MKKYTYLIILIVAFACSKNDSSEFQEEEVIIEEPELEEPELVEANSEGYPFNLPEKVTATLSINSSSKTAANNLLLGINFGGYTTTQEKEIVRYLDPVGIRFPSGVWSNWYNWEKDISEYDPTDTYDIGAFHKQVMDDYAKYGLYTGFEGMKAMHDELNFNVLFTYNINYDSNEKSVARLKDRVSKGFDVNYIELGNEQFWKNQRSGRIATPELYYPIAKSISEALKAERPNVKLSVPLGWRSTQDNYNAAIAKTTDYFDAITLHRYVHHQKDDAVKSSDTYKSILTSRLEIEESKNFVRNHAAGKPIWLTEWGVSCGLNAASYLGQADAYLYLFDNQIDFQRAEWFGATTALNPMYIYSDAILDNRGRPERSVRNIKKTGHGAVFEILKKVFRNSDILATEISTFELTTGSNAIEAKAVLKNGNIEIFAVNKTYKSVTFNMKIDNTDYNGAYRLEALKYESLKDDRLLNNYEDPLKLIKNGTGVIILPPYSINRISEIK